MNPSHILLLSMPFLGWVAQLEAQVDFVRGDAEPTGDITLGDVALIACAGTGCAEVFPCIAALDASGDGLVNISDSLFLLNYLFRGGPAPPAPFPAPGPDPNGFECLAYDPRPAPSDPRVQLAVRSKGFTNFIAYPAVVQLEGSEGADYVTGWSFGIQTDASCEIVSATTAGTIADGVQHGGFEHTELVRGAEPGVVSAVILNLLAPEFVDPFQGPHDILKLEWRQTFGLKKVCFTCEARFVEGLQGSGRPVPVRILHGGFSAVPELKLAWSLFSCDTFPPPPPSGDCNSDGRMDVSDPIFILNFLFLGLEAPRDPRSCDVNGDIALSLSDAIYLLNFLFLGGPEPVGLHI